MPACRARPQRGCERAPTGKQRAWKSDEDKRAVEPSAPPRCATSAPARRGAGRARQHVGTSISWPRRARPSRLGWERCRLSIEAAGVLRSRNAGHREGVSTPTASGRARVGRGRRARTRETGERTRPGGPVVSGCRGAGSVGAFTHARAHARGSRCSPLCVVACVNTPVQCLRALQAAGSGVRDPPQLTASPQASAVVTVPALLSVATVAPGSMARRARCGVASSRAGAVLEGARMMVRGDDLLSCIDALRAGATSLHRELDQARGRRRAGSPFCKTVGDRGYAQRSEPGGRHRPARHERQ